MVSSSSSNRILSRQAQKQVTAHEMGHNLGMNHDGETTEGNRCSPDQFLMSPVLGPGKVTQEEGELSRTFFFL